MKLEDGKQHTHTPVVTPNNTKLLRPSKLLRSQLFHRHPSRRVHQAQEHMQLSLSHTRTHTPAARPLGCRWGGCPVCAAQCPRPQAALACPRRSSPRWRAALGPPPPRAPQHHPVAWQDLWPSGCKHTREQAITQPCAKDETVHRCSLPTEDGAVAAPAQCNRP